MDRPFLCAMPFVSQAQAAWAFANKKPFAKRWARATGPYKKLPAKVEKKDVTAAPMAAGYVSGPGGLMSAPGMGKMRLPKRKKVLTLKQLETFVSSSHYDPATADAIARRLPRIPALKEQIAPGISRIHGNLCNVHGKYGPCDKAIATLPKSPGMPSEASLYSVSKPKPKKGKKPKRSAAGKKKADALKKAAAAKKLADKKAEQAKRQTAAAGKRSAAQMERALAANARHAAQAQAQAKRQQAQADRLAKQGAKKPATSAAPSKTAAPAKASAPGKTRAGTPAPPKVPVKAPVASAAPSKPASSSSSSSGGGGAKPFQATVAKPEKPAPAPAKQIAPALTDAASALSAGKPMSDSDIQALVRNGLAKLDKDGKPILTPAGLAATKKDFSFRVFKDARGNARWVAQSSTAYQDRDKEIVSTQALADDCAVADQAGVYGPLRWWHTPSLDLGDCDFNAMHGKVLIESGTFRSPSIAQKVAQAADALEISLGFLHLPTEPDASGVFHHIRRFERSLVPKGKASNPFTAFRIKERPMFDPVKVAALKQLGFSDADITGLQSQAEATEKAADAQGVAFKAEEPAELPDVVINGVTYKAFPAKGAQPAEGAPGAGGLIEGSPEEEAAESPAEEAGELAAGEGDAGGDGLTLSPEDISAIGQAVSDALQTALGPLVSTMDLTNKIGGHMDELKSMMGGYTAKKDSEQAERDTQVATLKATIDSTQAKLNELLGLQPEVAPRASAAPTSALNPFNPADNALLASIKDQVPQDQLGFVDEFADLRKNLFSQ